MGIAGKKLAIINVGTDLGNYVIRLEENGKVTSLEEEKETTDDENEWYFSDKLLVISFFNSSVVYVGKSIEDEKIIGKATASNGMEWLFLAIKNSTWLFDQRKDINVLKQILTGVRWKITAEHNTKKISFYITFRQDGSLFTSQSTYLFKDAWDIIENRIVFRTHFNYVGNFTAAGFSGSGSFGKRHWNYYAEIDEKEKLGMYFLNDDLCKSNQIQSSYKGVENHVFINAKYNENEISTLGVYHKYWLVKDEIRNPECDAYSKMILALKRQEVHALNYFYKEINPLLSSSKFTICYVPSSDPANTNSGIKTLARRLASTNERINATDCIVRIKKIPKLATGGGRNLSVHLNSLKIEETHLIEGKVILLLDDVTTTNNSLNACKQLLLDAGAKTVYCFALGQTS